MLNTRSGRRASVPGTLLALRLFPRVLLMKQLSERGILALLVAMLAGSLAAGCRTGTGVNDQPDAVRPTLSVVSLSGPTPKPLPSPPGWILGPDEVPTDLPARSLRLERIGIEDGLSHSAVWKILQDSEGYMWFGTQDGLNRYDGYNFAVYRHDPNDPQSLRDDYVSSMYEDRSGVLWIGTQQGWLEKYDREQDRFTPYHIGSWITSLYEDRSGLLWIGAQAGLYRFDREAEQATLITSERGWVEVVYEDREGQLWFGTEDGWFSTLDRSSGQFVTVTRIWLRTACSNSRSMNTRLEQVVSGQLYRIWRSF